MVPVAEKLGMVPVAEELGMVPVVGEFGMVPVVGEFGMVPVELDTEALTLSFPLDIITSKENHNMYYIRSDILCFIPPTLKKLRAI